ncbi:hypothetical protein FAM09_11915 [Niastella caeni]|uniref:DUF4397 domain-containing protein n=1 Tax=Niastella caeni TaxID=2569763 RepID=A0A4S8HYG6_9BACT|nr:hypothetical protein [Niastella caeni]THU39214.1 hypothetical protein FAM09_11915 [Niastella caeni]
MKKEIHNIIRKINMLSIINKCSVGLLFVYCIGCSKGEEAIEPLRFTTVGLNAVTVDSFRFAVTDNGTLLTDSLITPVGNRSMVVKYKETVRRYRVTDLYSNSLLLDTLINYKPGSLNAITFFQPTAGSKLVWVGPPANEPAPEAGKIKLSVVYASPFTTAKYDEIKVVVENSQSGNSGTDYVAKDSFLLKRGEFSRFFTGGLDRKPRLRLYTTDASRAALATLNPASFSEANSDFSIFYININSTTSAALTKFY